MGLLGQIERRVRFGVVCCAWTRGSAEMAFYDQINWENFLDLIYWRDTQKSGVVYGSGMAFLLLLRWMSLIILGYVALFTLPKVYEINQVQIDQYIDLVRTHFEEIQSKVRSMIPLGGSKEKAQ